MSSRGNRPNRSVVVCDHNSKLTPAEKLETLRLYIEHQSSKKVGEILGVSGASIRFRLHAMGVRLLPVGASDQDVVTLNGPEFLADLDRRLSAAVLDPVGQKVRTSLPWTPAEDVAVMRLDLPVTALATQINRTPSAIYQRRRLLRRRVSGD